MLLSWSKGRWRIGRFARITEVGRRAALPIWRPTWCVPLLASVAASAHPQRFHGYCGPDLARVPKGQTLFVGPQRRVVEATKGYERTKDRAEHMAGTLRRNSG